MSLGSALKWSFLAELATKGITPIVLLVLAQLLTPEDFGIMAAAAMVIAFTQIFWEAGMSKALIQRQSDVDAAANVCFWVNIGLAGLIGVGLWSAAEPIAARFFQDGRVAPVLRVMTLQVLLSALAAVHTALLQKQFRFRRLFWVRMLTVALPGLASIPLAFLGMGYWSLVVGALTGSLAQLVTLWALSRWRPRLQFPPRVALEMARFAGWVTLSALLGWFFVWADALVVGMFLGSHDLGIYRTGNQLVLFVFLGLVSPLLPVLYSHFVRLDSEAELRRHLAQAVNALALVCLPLAFALFAISGVIERFLFDETWQGIGTVIGIMGLSHGIAFLFQLNGEAFRAAGKPSFETWPMIFGLCVYLPIYVLTIQHGLEVFVTARLLAMASIGVLIHCLLARAGLGVAPGLFLQHAIPFALGAGLLLWAHWQALPPGSTAALAAAFAVSSFMLIAWRHRHSLLEALQALRAARPE